MNASVAGRFDGAKALHGFALHEVVELEDRAYLDLGFQPFAAYRRSTFLRIARGAISTSVPSP